MLFMSIEKMSRVNIVGTINRLDETIAKCISSGIFHPEPANNSRHDNSAGLSKSSEIILIHHRFNKLLISVSEWDMI